MVDKPVYCDVQRENAAKQNVTDEEDAEEGKEEEEEEKPDISKNETRNISKGSQVNKRC